MILDAILLLFQGIINVLLAPLSVINWAVDLVSSVPVIANFLSIVAYVLPWGNILPLISLIVGMFIFRIFISLIKTIWELLPIL